MTGFKTNFKHFLFKKTGILSNFCIEKLTQEEVNICAFLGKF